MKVQGGALGPSGGAGLRPPTISQVFALFPFGLKARGLKGVRGGTVGTPGCALFSPVCVCRGGGLLAPTGEFPQIRPPNHPLK